MFKNYGVFDLHQNVSDFFVKALKSSSLSHAYLLHGKRGVGKFDFAKELTKVILSHEIQSLSTINSLSYQENKDTLLVDSGSHPNLMILQKDEDKKYITVEKVRELFDFLNKTSYSGNKYKIVIIESIDYMNVNASNALLKNLEEPHQNTLFLIICHNISSLLPTISSRCVKQQFCNLSKEKVESFLNAQQLEENYIKDKAKIAELSDGSLFLIQKVINDKEFYNIFSSIVNFLENIQTTRAFDFISHITTIKSIKVDDFIILLDIIKHYTKHQSLEDVENLLNFYKTDGVLYNASLKDMLINLLITLKLNIIST